MTQREIEDILNELLEKGFSFKTRKIKGRGLEILEIYKKQ